jgi:V-type H+-transporting ATPase subunit a
LNGELNAFQRKFISEIRRCEEMGRKLNYIRKEILMDELELKEIGLNDIPHAPNPREFIDLEAQFEKTENEVMELSENFAQLLTNFQELTELRCVLERTQVTFNYPILSLVV